MLAICLHLKWHSQGKNENFSPFQAAFLQPVKHTMTPQSHESLTVDIWRNTENKDPYLNSFLQQGTWTQPRPQDHYNLWFKKYHITTCRGCFSHTRGLQLDKRLHVSGGSGGCVCTSAPQLWSWRLLLHLLSLHNHVCLQGPSPETGAVSAPLQPEPLVVLNSKLTLQGGLEKPASFVY